MHAVIQDPAYQINSEMEIDMVSRLADRFQNTTLVMPEVQRTMYEKITERLVVNDKGSAKRMVADVGCGLGIGTNILAKEARFVWGVDRSADNISFASQMFGVDPRLRFETLNICDVPREVARFDVVACIEVLEHIEDPEKAIHFLKRLSGPLGKTVTWISVPNRNSPLLQKDKPRNPHHVGEPTSAEIYDLLIRHYRYVVQFTADLSKTVDLDTQETPLLLKCEEPL